MQVSGHFRENGDYLTDLLTDEAIGFIRRNNPNETHKPFFLYLAHHAVHTPIQAKKEYRQEFESREAVGCHNHAAYAAMIESVDESVARISGTLEELELSKNTVIIFSRTMVAMAPILVKNHCAEARVCFMRGNSCTHVRVLAWHGGRGLPM